MAENKDEETTTPTRSRAATATAEPEPAEAPAPPKPGEVVKTDGGIDTKDILGGNIAETINIPVETAPKDKTRQMELMLRAAKASGTKKLAPLVGRPLEEWGLVGEGDEVRGHYILVDLDSLKKVEVVDYWKIDVDRVFANAQQLPKLLMAGDSLDKL